jgi:hypothetical protein
MAREDYARLPGKERRYQNTKTGEVISRRQFDQRFGRLAGTGLTLEKQARSNLLRDPSLSMARPARGRKSAIPKPAKEIKAKPAPVSEARKKQLASLRAKARRRLKKDVYKSVNSQHGGRINVRIPFDGTEQGAIAVLKAASSGDQEFSYVRVIFKREDQSFHSTPWFFNPYLKSDGFNPKKRDSENFDIQFNENWDNEVENKLLLIYGQQGEVIGAELHLMMPYFGK